MRKKDVVKHVHDRHSPIDGPPRRGEHPRRTRNQNKVSSSRKHDLTIRVRRVRTDPAQKREQFITRLDSAVETIEKILNDPETSELTRIKAANTMAWILRASYTIVRDIDIENLEYELAQIRAENKAKKNTPVHFELAPLPQQVNAERGTDDTATDSPP